MRFRHLVFLTFFVFLPGVSWASCTGSGMTWTCTANSTAAQINTAIGSASEGATITFGAGSGSWSSTVTITKGIHLIGAGSSSTIITSSGANPMLRILPTSDALNSEFEVSGFAFNTANQAIAIALGEYNYQPTTFQTKVNIHDNAFSGTTTANSDYQYIFNYNMGGVVWKNTFTGRDQQIRSLGYGYDAIFGLVPLHSGTANALYIEDNVFTINTPSDSYIADCQFGGVKRVWRYNTFTTNNNMGGSGFIDVHEADDAAMTSCFGDEIYGNKLTLTNNGYASWLAARGGKSFVFYNDVITTGAVSGGLYYSTGGYCAATYGSTHQWIRYYMWNNRKNTTTNINDASPSCGPGECNFTCDGATNAYPAENKQIFNFKPSFNGTAGTGCGSSLPTPTGYANRVGFWLTSQSCSSVAGLVGDIVNNPTRGTITGALYEVQGGAWVKIYDPYTYPHPLRTTPGAPTGLTIIP